MKHLRRTGFVVLWSIVSLVAFSAAMPTSATEEGMGGDVGGENAHALLVTTHALFEALFIDGDADTVKRIIGDDAEIRTPLTEGTGANSLVAYVDRVKTIYPGAAFDITSVTLNGLTVEVRWRISGEEFRIDPVGASEPALVEGSGQLVIYYGRPWADEVFAVGTTYETAISPLSSQESAGGLPVQERPGMSY